MQKATKTFKQSPEQTSKRKRGVQPHPIVEFPAPSSGPWEDPSCFHQALDLHMRRHGDTCHRLSRAISHLRNRLDIKTVVHWRRGTKAPRSVESFKTLEKIENRYQLPEGYFKAKLPARSLHGHKTKAGGAEQRKLAWHLPHDFNKRSAQEKKIIIKWIQENIIRGSTAYRKFQAETQKHPYALRFPELACSDRNLDSAPQLTKEFSDLLHFKTSTFVDFGFNRSGYWGPETASQKIEHLGLLFGALSAPADGPVRGLGLPLTLLTFAMLVFPSVWDAYLKWREKRRGFYTVWEIDMLRFGLAITRAETGWLRQNPSLSQKLTPIDGIISKQEISKAINNWNYTCDTFQKYALTRVKEIQRTARVHRDPFEPILVILESDSPVSEYRKITEEILSHLPDERRHPIARAESIRSYLMLRLGLHTGLRQKNMRQLLLCSHHDTPTTESRLNELKRGELRWNGNENGWEIFIPSIAFKNAKSSYFGNKPFRIILPDLGDLYTHIENYVARHRKILLKDATDPKTFFVKTVNGRGGCAAYCQIGFYQAWRHTIQRYGIFNPYTKRGAIKGLLPHGPHNIRDVLATHILKKTGSYERASYAIQDTPEMVAKHYGRFLPQDKTALAAEILNIAWL